MLRRRQVRVQAVVLRTNAQHAVDLVHLGPDRHPFHPSLARGRRVHAGQHVGKRCFPRPVVAQQRQRPSVLDPHRHVADRHKAPKLLPQVPQHQRRVRHSIPLQRTRLFHLHIRVHPLDVPRTARNNLLVVGFALGRDTAPDTRPVLGAEAKQRVLGRPLSGRKHLLQPQRCRPQNHNLDREKQIHVAHGELVARHVLPLDTVRNGNATREVVDAARKRKVRVEREQALHRLVPFHKAPQDHGREPREKDQDVGPDGGLGLGRKERRKHKHHGNHGQPPQDKEEEVDACRVSGDKLDVGRVTDDHNDGGSRQVLDKGQDKVDCPVHTHPQPHELHDAGQLLLLVVEDGAHVERELEKQYQRKQDQCQQRHNVLRLGPRQVGCQSHLHPKRLGRVECVLERPKRCSCVQRVERKVPLHPCPVKQQVERQSTRAQVVRRDVDPASPRPVGVVRGKQCGLYGRYRVKQGRGKEPIRIQHSGRERRDTGERYAGGGGGTAGPRQIPGRRTKCKVFAVGLDPEKERGLERERSRLENDPLGSSR